MAVLCACEQPKPASCEVVPPPGPFEVRVEPAPAPATLRALPENAETSSVLIAPAPRHRWSADQGLVETKDGSLLLHGAVRAPNDTPTQLRFTVLVGYEPVEARLTVWTPDRREKITSATGTHVVAPLDGAMAAFDIEVPPGTVPIGRWQEVQTVVSLGETPPDVRRWTLSAGPKPPPAVACQEGGSRTAAGSRSSLSPDGELTIVARRAAKLGIVPFDRDSIPAGNAKFIVLDKGETWTRMQPPSAHLVAVFEGAFTGPQNNWISNFWSATRSKAVPSSKVR